MFQPSADISTLQQRAQLIKKIRDFFDRRGFFEVDTPVLSRDIVVDRHLHPIQVERTQVDGVKHSGQFWLQTSPEFAMKRLVAAGAEAIYQIGHAFRAAEKGELHNPEFTMLEWYRVGDDLQAGIDLLADLTRVVFGAASVERISYRSAFQSYAQLDPFDSSIADYQRVAQRNRIQIDEFSTVMDLDFWRNLLLSNVIEPALGHANPVIVFDWPASQSALAKTRGSDPVVAERFELYVQGTELANGYHELLDAEELLQRNQQNNRLRELDGNQALPNESRLLDAMRHGLPACSGVALGIDRLVMLALGKKTIREVMTFPIDIA